jgi:hypothetical protein
VFYCNIAETRSQRDCVSHRPGVGGINVEQSVMKKAALHILSILVLALGVSAGPVMAQDTASPGVKTAESNPGPESGFDALLGLWVRPDGGYLIAIRGIESGGRLDAAYANPHQLLFSRAEASREGDTIRVFLELRAGGYNGSTYTLTYDPVNDTLNGVYYQAVARQKFDVTFERTR